MSFWGIEVKPGKPITHSCEKARGRLRISQATLGIGEATKRTIVQCNVGKRAPVLLCALLPNQTESCHLDLEFEEADDVIFSVIGPRSVYLTGYYVRQSPQLNPHSDTESYGVDIENTQTEGSSYGSDEDNYEDSFINDDDELQVSPDLPILSDKGIDEVTPENDKPKARMGLGKQRKKKFQVVESDNEDDHLPESEDDDAYTLSAFRCKRAAKRAPSDTEKITDVTTKVDNEAYDEGVYDASKRKLGSSVSNVDDKVADARKKLGGEAKDKDLCDESNQKVNPLDINEELRRVIRFPLELDEEATNAGNKMNDLPNPKKADSFKGMISSNVDVATGETVEGEDQIQPHDLAKPKKKRKERTVREDHNVLAEDKGRLVEASMDMETDANCAAMLLELGSVNDHKVKRRKTSLQLEGPQAEEIDKKHQTIPKDDAFEPLLHSNSKIDGEYQEHMEGASTEGVDTKLDSMLQEGEVNPGLQHVDCKTMDTLMSNGEFQEQKIDNHTSINVELLANDTQPGKKDKKKKRKGQDKRDLNKGLPGTTNGEEATPVKGEDENKNTVPIKRRTLSSGLIIEELANGPPDGRVASPGKKVKIYYTGVLKENEFVFDSNVGKSPFRFRLGDEAYIDGWNVGIDGMRIGDRRRLIIPPSMGFGDHGMGELVPPNSWLVYTVELVSIRK